MMLLNKTTEGIDFPGLLHCESVCDNSILNLARKSHNIDQKIERKKMSKNGNLMIF